MVVSKLFGLISKKKEVLLFLGARGASISVKPLLLWYLLNSDLDGFAELISLYYLCHGTLMIIFNNEAHFDFYKVLYGKGTGKYQLAKEELFYYKYFLYHFAAFALVVLTFTFFLSDSWLFFVPFFILIVYEKIIDEIQRFLLFNKSFVRWSLLMISKSTLPAASVVIISLNNNSVTQLFIAYFTAFTLLIGIICHFSFRRKQVTTFINIVSGINRRSLMQYLDRYRKKLVFNQLQSLFSRNIPLTDRLIVRVVSVAMLAEMSLIAQIGSIPILVVDFFLLSTRRKEYLDPTKQVDHISSKVKTLLFFLGSYLLFFSLVAPLLHFDLIKFDNFNSNIILLIGLYYSLFSISQHYANFNFWRVKRVITLSIDIFYYLLIFILFAISFSQYSFLTSLIIALLVGHVARLILLIYVSYNSRLHVNS